MLGKLQSVADRTVYAVLPLLFIGLIPIGLISGMPWLGLAVGALVVPTVDEIIGRRQGTSTGPTPMAARIFLVAFLAAQGWELVRASRMESWSGIVLAGLSSGYVFGAVATS
ncbi:MAG TPA: hypothetical protein VFA20_01765, partial [Myxococcaceae bacterium]|nr:hypothetical protein [Myxococcaceae bacterium]